MLEILKSVIKNVLTEIYEPFWLCLILSVIFMYVYKQGDSFKTVIKKWITWFKTDVSFRKLFLLVFYITLLLFITLSNKAMALNPVGNVIGGWKFYELDKDSRQKALESLVLFIPLTILLFWNFSGVLLKKINIKSVILQSVKITFLVSLSIEFLQLFLRLGAWQLSDMFYNTLGGTIGGILYWVVYRVKKTKKQKFKER